MMHRHAPVSLALALCLALGGVATAQAPNSRADLFEAIKSRSAGELRRVLAAGADPNLRPGDDWAPINGAAFGGNAEMVRILLGAGARPDGGVEGESGPLESAAFVGHEEVVALLLEAGADPNPRKTTSPPLVGAAIRDFRRIVRRLLDAGADPNGADQTGLTALMTAAGHGNGITARMLIAAGANVNATSADWTALAAAAVNEKPDAFLALLATRRVDVNGCGKDGRTALMVAAQMNRVDRIEMLLAAGARLEATDASGRTAIWYATGDGTGDALRALVKAGAVIPPWAAGATREDLLGALSRDDLELAVEVARRHVVAAASKSEPPRLEIEPWRRAIAELPKVLREKPDSAERRVNRAQIAWMLGDHALAIRLYGEMAANIKPSHASTWVLEGATCATLAGDSQRAAALVARARELNSTDVDRAFARNPLLAEQPPAEATRLEWAHRLATTSHSRTQVPQDFAAVRVLEALAGEASSPEHRTKALLALVQLYERWTDFPAAERAAERLAEGAPGEPAKRAAGFLVRFAERVGRLADERRWRERRAAMEPDERQRGGDEIASALLCGRLGDEAEMVKRLEALADPQDPRSRGGLARAAALVELGDRAAERGDHEEALARYVLAIDVGRRSNEGMRATCAAARLLARLDRADEAMRDHLEPLLAEAGYLTLRELVALYAELAERTGRIDEALRFVGSLDGPQYGSPTAAAREVEVALRLRIASRAGDVQPLVEKLEQRREEAWAVASIPDSTSHDSWHDRVLVLALADAGAAAVPALQAFYERNLGGDERRPDADIAARRELAILCLATSRAPAARTYLDRLLKGARAGKDVGMSPTEIERIMRVAGELRDQNRAR